MLLLLEFYGAYHARKHYFSLTHKGDGKLGARHAHLATLRAKHGFLGRIKLYFAATANEQLVFFRTFERKAGKRRRTRARKRACARLPRLFFLVFHNLCPQVMDIAKIIGISIFM